jgi:ubiquitin C
MQVFIKMLSDRKFTIDVDPSDTLENLKAKILAAEDIPSEHQWLIFGGNHLVDDGKSLADFGICNESTLFLIIWVE